MARRDRAWLVPREAAGHDHASWAGGRARYSDPVRADAVGYPNGVHQDDEDPWAILVPRDPHGLADPALQPGEWQVDEVGGAGRRLSNPLAHGRLLSVRRERPAYSRGGQGGGEQVQHR